MGLLLFVKKTCQKAAGMQIGFPRSRVCFFYTPLSPCPPDFGVGILWVQIHLRNLEVECPKLSGRQSLFSVYVLFPQVFVIHSQAFSATRTPPFTQSLLCPLFTVFYSQPMVHYHSNHIHVCTPITQIVAAKVSTCI